MKACAYILLFVFCAVECRKLVPINKNANIDFINMESGGVRGQPAAQSPGKAPAAPTPAPAPAAPAPTTKPPTSAPAVKPLPQPTPITVKPLQPAQQPNQIKPVPVNPTPASIPKTTPGPGSVKQLITFYDSQGKASLIRPYSYSQAVKQG